jgi:hypothetical protein
MLPRTWMQLCPWEPLTEKIHTAYNACPVGKSAVNPWDDIHPFPSASGHVMLLMHTFHGPATMACHASLANQPIQQNHASYTHYY